MSLSPVPLTFYLKDITTKGDLEVAKLALQKEIEQGRKELREGELRLQKEIEQVRKEFKEGELRLQREIEEVRKELKEVELRLQREIERVKASVIKWVVGLLLVQTGVIVSIIGLLR